MITYEGKKYACVSCIRGHRSSSCDHRERPLLQVRKRGRPLPENAQRIAILPEARNGDRIFKPISKIEAEENELIYTDKYVFEAVGDGLYKKHFLSEFIRPIKDEATTPSPFTSEFERDPSLIAPMNLNIADLEHQLGVTHEEANSIWPHGNPDFIPSCVMPNQCQCGDDCACADCYTHGRKAQTY